MTRYLFAYIDITSANEMERKEQERGQVAPKIENYSWQEVLVLREAANK